MKRYFAFVATAVLTTAFATSTFAGWGPNGQFGVADPNARPVGQSSTPSTNPASAPILNPPDPTRNLGAVPGSYMDPAVQARLSKAELAARIAKAKAAFDKKNTSPRFLPQQLHSPLNVSTSHLNHNTGFFGHDVTKQVPQMPKPSKINSVPPRPHFR